MGLLPQGELTQGDVWQSVFARRLTYDHLVRQQQPSALRFQVNRV